MRIDRNGATLWLTVDNEQHRDRLEGGQDDGSLDVGSTLYVGGTRSADRLPWWVYSRRRPDFYRGCVWDVRVDNGDIVELQRLLREQRMRGISAGCAAMPDECGTAACQHRSVCRDRWAGHLCDCAMTHYTGTRCERGLYAAPASYVCVSSSVNSITIAAVGWAI